MNSTKALQNNEFLWDHRNTSQDCTSVRLQFHIATVPLIKAIFTYNQGLIQEETRKNEALSLRIFRFFFFIFNLHLLCNVTLNHVKSFMFEYFISQLKSSLPNLTNIGKYGEENWKKISN